MKDLILIFLLLSLLSILINASTPSEYYEDLYATLPEHRKGGVSVYLDMPFRQFISADGNRRRTNLFQMALIRRPEFEHIDWHSDDCIALAKQLWAFQSDDSDHGYHRRINAITKLMMQLQGVEDDKINTVVKIITTWVKARNKRKAEDKKADIGETQQERDARLSTKRMVIRKTEEERKQGLSMPLIQYLREYPIQQMTIEEIHEAALTFQEKYRSSHSYLANLRQLWKDLKYDDDQVYFQNHDKMNTQCKKWSRKKDRMDQADDSATAVVEQGPVEDAHDGLDQAQIESGFSQGEEAASSLTATSSNDYDDVYANLTDLTFSSQPTHDHDIWSFHDDEPLWQSSCSTGGLSYEHTPLPDWD